MKFYLVALRRISLTFCLLILVDSISGNSIPEEKERVFQDRVDKLSTILEKFDALQLVSLDKKLSSITGAITQVDSNVRSLHEKSGTWNILMHHVQAWTDSMKAIDHKVDLIKLAQDEVENLENKLNSMEFSLNHILARLDALSEKSRTIGPDLLDKIDSILKIVQGRELIDNLEQKEVSRKLNAIMRHILTLDNGKNRESRRAKMTSGTQSEVEYYNQNFEAIEYKVDRVLEQLSGVSDLQEVIQNERKSSEIMENLLELMKSVDERTVRLFDAEAQHSSKMLSCCRHSSDELATFTGSSDLLLKRIEKLVAGIQNQVRKLFEAKKDSEIQGAVDQNPRTDVDSEKTKPEAETDDEAPIKANQPKNGLDSTNPDEKDEESSDERKNEDTEGDDSANAKDNESPTGRPKLSEEEAKVEQDADVVQTGVTDSSKKSGCHEIEERVDGLYRFKNVSYDEGRSFYERYCTFSTDGPGWTVIQRRGPYEIQEIFNRTWEDYKQGFGDLHRDFWFGNEFIYRMVYKDIHELRIELEDFDGVQKWAQYSMFQIESEKNNYKLVLSGFRGSVTDSMIYSDLMQFSTYDRQHDRASRTKCCSCAAGYGSGWWFDKYIGGDFYRGTFANHFICSCSEANLNGIYRDTPDMHNYIGVVWENWHGDYSLKKTRMMIRPRNIWLEEGNGDEDVFSNIPEDP